MRFAHCSPNSTLILDIKDRIPIFHSAASQVDRIAHCRLCPASWLPSILPHRSRWTSAGSRFGIHPIRGDRQNFLVRPLVR